MNIEKLTDEEVQVILMASGELHRFRKRKLEELSANYANKLRKLAEQFVSTWCDEGVPLATWEKLRASPLLVSKYSLNKQREVRKNVEYHK